MKIHRYRIMNRITKDWSTQDAKSPQEACTMAGWPINDCLVKQYVHPHPDPTKEGGYHSGGWKGAR